MKSSHPDIKGKSGHGDTHRRRPMGSPREKTVYEPKNAWGFQAGRDTGTDFLSLPHKSSLVAQLVKNLPVMWETWVQSLGWEDPLEKGKATHCSILSWRIPWTV